MFKNKVIATLIICAVAFSALAVYLIYRYMSPSRSTIFVFNSDYSVGQQITSDMLVPVQVDSTAIYGGNRMSLSDARFVTPADYPEVVRSGDSLRMDVSEGMPLTVNMLSVSGGSTVEMNMKNDSVAVTVPVNEFSGVTNDLKDGARVNIYCTNGDQTTLIQQDKRILQVFKNEGEIVGVAVEEDVYESMELINAMSNGTIYLGLIDQNGYTPVEGEDPHYTSVNLGYSEEELNQMQEMLTFYEEEKAAGTNDAASTQITDEDFYNIDREEETGN